MQCKPRLSNDFQELTGGKYLYWKLYEDKFPEFFKSTFKMEQQNSMHNILNRLFFPFLPHHLLLNVKI